MSALRILCCFIVSLPEIYRMKLLILDNHDSFTFNLVQIVREWGKCNYSVASVDQLLNIDINSFDKVLISPGPGLPDDNPRLNQAIGQAYQRLSILGVCLGHQAIACYFGGKLKKARTICHGESSEVRLGYYSSPIFKLLPKEFNVGRYHSWVVDPKNHGSDLQITAITGNGTIMALQHASLPIYGVQFHPESVMTPHGVRIVRNWLNL